MFVDFPAYGGSPPTDRQQGEKNEKETSENEYRKIISGASNGLRGVGPSKPDNQW